MPTNSFLSSLYRRHLSLYLESLALHLSWAAVVGLGVVGVGLVIKGLMTKGFLDRLQSQITDTFPLITQDTTSMPATTADDLFVQLSDLAGFADYVASNPKLDDSLKSGVQSVIASDKAIVEGQAAAAIIAATPADQGFPDVVKASDGSLHVVGNSSNGGLTLNVAVVVNASDIPLPGVDPAPVVNPTPVPTPDPVPSPVDPNAPVT